MNDFQIVGNIELRGPGSQQINQITSQIRNSLGSIGNTQINFSGLDNLDTAGVNSYSTAIRGLAANLNVASTQASNAADRVGRLSDVLRGGIGGLEGVARQSRVVTTEVASSAASVRDASLAFESLSGNIVRSLGSYAQFTVATQIVSEFRNAIESAINAVIGLDDTQIRLIQITGQSSSAIRGLTDEVFSLGRSLGVSTGELLQASTTLSQAGFQLREAQQILEVIAQADLGPTFGNIEDITQGVIAIGNQFNLIGSGREQEVFRRALSSISNVANEFATDASDVIDAVRVAGGVFAASSRGVDEFGSGLQGANARIDDSLETLEEFTALVNTVRSTTRQSANVIGTGLRTITVRLQRLRTETDLQSLFGEDFSLRDQQGNFIGVLESFRAISDALDGLPANSTEFARTLEVIGGQRQFRTAIPIVQDFDRVLRSLEVAQSDYNSVVEDALIAQNALSVQIARLQRELVAVFATIQSSDQFARFFEAAVFSARTLIEALQVIGNILPGLAAGVFANGVFNLGGRIRRGVLGDDESRDAAAARNAQISRINGEISAISNLDVSSQLTEISSGTATINSGNIDADIERATQIVQQSTIDVRNAIITGAGLNTSRAGDVLFPRGTRRPLNSGGKVRRVGLNTGGIVPVALTPGEAVIPQRQAERFGYDNLTRLNRMRLNTGGIVPGSGNTDSFFTNSREGDFVLNREATQFAIARGILGVGPNGVSLSRRQGLNKGGAVGRQRLNSGGSIRQRLMPGGPVFGQGGSSDNLLDSFARLVLSGDLTEQQFNALAETSNLSVSALRELDATIRATASAVNLAEESVSSFSELVQTETANILRGQSVLPGNNTGALDMQNTPVADSTAATSALISNLPSLSERAGLPDNDDPVSARQNIPDVPVTLVEEVNPAFLELVEAVQGDVNPDFLELVMATQNPGPITTLNPINQEIINNRNEDAERGTGQGRLETAARRRAVAEASASPFGTEINDVNFARFIGQRDDRNSVQRNLGIGQGSLNDQLGAALRNSPSFNGGEQEISESVDRFADILEQRGASEQEIIAAYMQAVDELNSGTAMVERLRRDERRLQNAAITERNQSRALGLGTASGLAAAGAGFLRADGNDGGLAATLSVVSQSAGAASGALSLVPSRFANLAGPLSLVAGAAVGVTAVFSEIRRFEIQELRANLEDATSFFEDSLRRLGEGTGNVEDVLNNFNITEGSRQDLEDRGRGTFVGDFLDGIGFDGTNINNLTSDIGNGGILARLIGESFDRSLVGLVVNGVDGNTDIAGDIERATANIEQESGRATINRLQSAASTPQIQAAAEQNLADLASGSTTDTTALDLSLIDDALAARANRAGNDAEAEINRQLANSTGPEEQNIQRILRVILSSRNTEIDAALERRINNASTVEQAATILSRESINELSAAIGARPAEEREGAIRTALEPELARLRPDAIMAEVRESTRIGLRQGLAAGIDDSRRSLSQIADILSANLSQAASNFENALAGIDNDQFAPILDDSQQVLDNLNGFSLDTINDALGDRGNGPAGQAAREVAELEAIRRQALDANQTANNDPNLTNEQRAADVDRVFRDSITNSSSGITEALMNIRNNIGDAAEAVQDTEALSFDQINQEIERESALRREVVSRTIELQNQAATQQATIVNRIASLASTIDQRSNDIANSLRDSQGAFDDIFLNDAQRSQASVDRERQRLNQLVSNANRPGGGQATTDANSLQRLIQQNTLEREAIRQNAATDIITPDQAESLDNLRRSSEQARAALDLLRDGTAAQDQIIRATNANRQQELNLLRISLGTQALNPQDQQELDNQRSLLTALDAGTNIDPAQFQNALAAIERFRDIDPNLAQEREFALNRANTNRIALENLSPRTIRDLQRQARDGARARTIQDVNGNDIQLTRDQDASRIFNRLLNNGVLNGRFNAVSNNPETRGQDLRTLARRGQGLATDDDIANRDRLDDRNNVRQGASDAINQLDQDNIGRLEQEFIRATQRFQDAIMSLPEQINNGGLTASNQMLTESNAALTASFAGFGGQIDQFNENLVAFSDSINSLNNASLQVNGQLNVNISGNQDLSDQVIENINTVFGERFDRLEFRIDNLG